MSKEKSIVETGYTVVRSLNGGFLVAPEDGLDLDFLKYTFTNTADLLEFLCKEHLLAEVGTN